VPVNVRPCMVHRCRFVADVWKPHAITAIAYSPSGQYAAVGRQNGNIEIWNVRQGWVVNRVRLLCIRPRFHCQRHSVADVLSKLPVR